MAQALLGRFGQTRRAARLQRSSDWWLLATVLTLLVIGLLMVYSATYLTAYYNSDGTTATTFFQKQALWAAIGGGVALLFWLIDYRFWKRLSIPIMIGTLVALGALFFVGQVQFGATRWLIGASIQPSEAAKLATIIYVAHWASSKEARLGDLRTGLIPFIFMMALVCGLIAIQPSFSTALMVGAVAGAMFFISGADIKQLLFVGSGVTALAYFIASAGWRISRFEAWRDPWGSATEAGYQTTHVLYALARGGWLGEGLGTTSAPTFPTIPAIHNDLIIAVLGHEGGLFACLLVLFLFLFLTYRGFQIALNAPDAFGTVLASGITCWFLFQSMLNFGVITNTIPPTGVPMPFISFGGSGLVTALAGVGILLNISKSTAKDS